MLVGARMWAWELGGGGGGGGSGSVKVGSKVSNKELLNKKREIFLSL